MTDVGKVPVTILTGFLGSGKTTLVNYILREFHGRRIAVIENEYGEIGIDSELVVSSDENIFEMTNGCVCCVTSVRQDILDVIAKLQERPGRFDHILIETSGLADPMPVAQAFFVENSVLDEVTLDAIVTLVDARHIEAHFDQVRADGIDNQAVDQIVCADRIILNKTDLVDAATLGRITERIRTLNQVASIVPSNYAKIDLDTILGIRAFEIAQRAVPDDVFLDTAYSHAHDPDVSSLSFRLDGDVDPDKLAAFVADLLAHRAVDIYRLKGIVGYPGEPLKVALQGVHDMFDTYPVGAWGDDPRQSRLVLIGRNLDERALDAGLRACQVANMSVFATELDRRRS